MAEKRIKITKNGPYHVTGDVPLVQAVIEPDENGISTNWGAGKKYEQRDEYFLCRCGRSANKPYCDGAHVKIGFIGDETATHGTGKQKTYSGQGVDMIDEESLCASMRFCDRAPRAWTAAVNSHIPEYKEIAIEEACNCVSGRLTAVDKNGNVYEPKFDQEISPVQDTAAGWRGPLWVKGGIQIEGADGQLYKIRNRVTLCRCGLSSNKPFCDTSHFNVQAMKGKDE